MENTKLNELLNLTTSEKLKLVYELLDSIKGASDIPEWHKDILEERLKKIENGKMEFVSWEKVKEMLLERIR